MFEVEWTTEIPADEFGDAILDHAVTHTKYFKTREAAFKFAEKVNPLDWFGAATVTECHEEQYWPWLLGKYIEYDAESETFS